MRFNVDRICELAGLGAASGGLLSEAAIPAAPAAKPGAKAPAPAAKPAVPSAPVKPAAKPAAPAPKMEDAEEEEEGMHYMDEDAEEEGYGMEEMGGYLDDDAMYEIDEMELAEALVTMRQQRLEESAVRDAVRDEIKRALSDKSSSWIYGSNKPSASQVGQIARGGFGFGFKR